MDLSNLLGKLRVAHDDASYSHAGRLAEYKRRRCQAWVGAQQQQYRAEEARVEAQLLHGHDRARENQRMEELMELSRALERQLSLERFELDLQLARDEHAHA